jgi:hypothetical protein
MCSSLTLTGQSTTGRILGTVTDPSAAAINRADVTIVNEGTSVKRTIATAQTGAYEFPNLEPGAYTLEVQAPQFQTYRVEHVDLQARQTIRLDASLPLAAGRQVVNVTGSIAPAINSETSNIAQTKSGRQLIGLPVTLGARAAGTTSPISTLTAQPGVQTDSNGGLTVLGGQPTWLSVTVDGISAVGIRSSGPLKELFPSLDTIEEIRVSEANNTAEFGGVSDITTISKSGTNLLHGAAFWNFQNSVMDANNPLSATKPFKIMNDFGASAGGPIVRNRTFYLASFEGLRLPRQQFVSQSVPSLAFRQGNLSSVTTPIYNPATGLPFPNNQIPVNPTSAKLLNLLFPLPNAGSPNSQTNNYQQLFRVPISSNQGDLRIDQVLSSRQTVFARWTYKDIQASVVPTGSASFGAYQTPDQDWGLTVAHTLVFRPNVLNELRGGFTGRNFSTGISENAATVQSQLAINGLPAAPPGAVLPNVQISGYQSSGAFSSMGSDRNYQLLDNLSWVKGRHSFKVGGDARYLAATSNTAGRSKSLGAYTFSGAVTSLASNGQTASTSNPAVIGSPVAAFLLGIPDTTSYASITAANLDAYSMHYAFYAQDDWQVSRKLTLNYGLRYEYSPMLHDRDNNVSNFLPDYVSIVNGQTVRGAVVVPNQQGLSLTNPGFAASIYPTPIITAQQAGIPSALRYSQKTDFAPRFGFAYRPFADTKTVVRGGYGVFRIIPLGGLVTALYGTNTINAPTFTQQIVNGQPTLQFPSPFPASVTQTVGTQTLVQAEQLHYRDPYVQQWNLTVEREIARNTALRLTYNGLIGTDLSTTINQNQVPANTVGYNVAKLSRPYPLWGLIQSVFNGASSRYNAGTVEVARRLLGGVQFQASYTLSKNLSNANGLAPTTFASENGFLIDDRFNPGIDIGNAAYTRRSRFLATFLAQLPFGRGHAYLKDVPALVNSIVGGWEFAGVALAQSGPFLTATVAGADPSGTGLVTLCGCNGRPDIVSGKSGNLASTSRSVSRWFDATAFVVPQNNIGRFGDAPVGNLVGPGTVGISASLLRKFQIAERIAAQLSVQSTNVINHVNYDIPNTVFNTAAFGKISNVQAAEGAGPRVIQVSVRIVF